MSNPIGIANISEINLLRKYLCFRFLGHDDESHVFQEMDPEAFFTFSIPFGMKGHTKVGKRSKTAIFDS